MNIVLRTQPERDESDKEASLTVEEIKYTKVKELMEQAGFYLDHNQYDRALEFYEEVLVIDPSNKEATRKLAEATLGAYQENVQQETAPAPQQRRGDAAAESRYRQGIADYRDGKYREALNEFTRALALDPRMEKARDMIKKARR